MIPDKKAANAVGGKTARACESCLTKRARWYCAADDAFLCQACDSSVHSANQLASRHERVPTRVRLEKMKMALQPAEKSPPAWHQGFTRKARTRRPTKPASFTPPSTAVATEAEKITNPIPLVPEIGSEDASPEENEEYLLYQVPIFDPFAAEFCDNGAETAMEDEFSRLLDDNGREEACDGLDNLHEFLPSDMDLAEFAADVESLLGTGLDEENCGIEGLGLLLDCKEEDGTDGCLEGRKVKVEDEDVGAATGCQQTVDLRFSYRSPVAGKEEKSAAGVAEKAMLKSECKAEEERKMLLRLNHEAVISAWASHGSPWTTGSRPEFNPNDCWPDFMGSCYGGSSSHLYGGEGSQLMRGGDEGREARVSRYREKRRTRLFSKKIRYEVRKLNAEKRPRMKGRFVKRSASFSGPAAFPYLVNK
ncbi:zinc finger protein CONSTANS-LIKE 16-like [Diospyros lotus]|uniref:zinc finger protein CONSTANS-LIKE 16-like n=1 Tax=Diospyros lotus TaxID=55363 RepID=UPI002256062A|nr:zinc finger protein CONSTANS-LIKE 16-like [Diospyros lotus]